MGGLSRLAGNSQKSRLCLSKNILFGLDDGLERVSSFQLVDS